MAYFQAYTNTHAPLAKLKEKFEAALAQEGVLAFQLQHVQTAFQTMSLNT